MNNKIIIIFQYDWAIQIHTINLINALIKSGESVVFCYCSCDTTYVSLNNLDKKVKILNINYDINPLQKKINSLCYLLFKRFIFFRRVNHIVIKKTLDLILPMHDYTFIGIEKKGFIWASKISKIIKSKLVYYSLELYETPEFYEPTEFNYLRKNEKNYFPNLDLLIIQDSFRLKEICRYNDFKIHTEKVYFLPVSINRIISNNLIDNKKIDLQNIRVMYFGKIAPHRFSNEICSLAKKVPTNFTIELHGNCSESHKVELINKHDAKNLKINNQLVQDSEIELLLIGSTIGICLYRTDNINDRYTAFSSEKIALYLSLGIPIISFKNESYDVLYNEFRCGESITQIDEFLLVAEKIIESYNFYSNQAIKAFEKYYSFKNNYIGLNTLL